MRLSQRIILAALVTLSIALVGNFGGRDLLENEANHEAQEEAAELMAPIDHFDAARAYPDAQVDLAAYEQALSMANVETNKSSAAADFSNVPWRIEGPSNLGGRINAIAIDPNNPNVMLLGAATGGIFKTTDGGTTWFPVFDSQPYLSIGDITFQPGSSSIVYAGTGDPNITGYPFIGNGIYKSTDGGNTWTNIGLGNTRVISRIVVDPVDHNRIYVAAMGLPMQRDQNRGVYLSTNGGATWSQSLFVADQAGVIDLKMDPVYRLVMYASSWDRIRTGSESLVKGPNAKVWKTTNGGQNWVQLGGGLPTGNQSRINLEVHPTNSNIVYACYVDTTLELGGIYKSLDAGSTWAPIPTSTLGGPFNGFGWYFANIFLNPYNPNDLYVLGVQLWRTRNNGASWEQVDPAWWTYDLHADKHDMVFTGPTSFYLATDGGVYYTNNDGQTWVDVESIPNSQTYRVAVNPHVPGYYTGGFQDNGTASGHHQALDQWQRIYGGDGFQPIYDMNPRTIVVETQNGDLSFSDDSAHIFTNFDIGLDLNDRRNWDMPVIHSSHNNETYYTGTYRLYANDGGIPFQSWFTISGDLTDGPNTPLFQHNITTIAESPFLPNLLYVGTADGNVHRTMDRGANWTIITAGLPNRYVTSIKASPLRLDDVFVTLSGYKDNSFTPHLFHSSDRGTTWQSAAGDLPPLALYDVLPHPTIDSVLVVASDAGVYASTNSGVHWDRVGTGMPYCPVYDMEWDLVDRRLVAGTHARSIMSFPMDSILLEPLGVTEALVAQVKLYPNPAHGQVQVRTDVVIDHWSLHAIDGSCVRRGAHLQNGQAILLEGLAAGSYFWRGTVHERSVTIRLTVQ